MKVMFLLIPLMAWGNCPFQVPGTCYELGRIYYEDAKFVKSIAVLRPTCDGGHGESCLLLSKIYKEQGHKTSSWERLKLACEYKNGPACYGIGEYFWRSSSAQKAIAYWKKGCQIGHSLSCDQFTATTQGHKDPWTKYIVRCSQREGEACFHLSGAPDSLLESERVTWSKSDLLKMSCRYRYVKGCLELGQNKNSSLSKRLHFATKACDYSSKEGCFLAGTLAYAAKQNVLGMAHLKSACTLGEPSACWMRGKKISKKDDRQRLEAFVLGCPKKEGIKESCWFAGQLLSKLKDPLKRNIYLKRGCLLGHGHSCSELAIFHLEKKKHSQALVYLKMACHHKWAESCYQMGQMLQNHSGSPQEVARYHKRACELGVARACQTRIPAGRK